MGLINDLGIKSKVSKSASTIEKAYNDQSAVQKIIESLILTQKEDEILFDWEYKQKLHRCRLTFVVQFLCGDMKASDAMCGRLAGCSINIARSNHDCDF